MIHCQQQDGCADPARYELINATGQHGCYCRQHAPTIERNLAYPILDMQTQQIFAAPTRYAYRLELRENTGPDRCQYCADGVRATYQLYYLPASGRACYRYLVCPKHALDFLPKHAFRPASTQESEPSR